MLNPSAVLAKIESGGFTHVVWIPDSFVGPWEASLVSSTKFQLIRPCREGEAIAIAAGLMLGGARPLVIVQCTGLFEAGDALRNVVHDLGLPLKLIVGVRSYQTFAAGKSNDNCPRFTEPILRAWHMPVTFLTELSDATLGASLDELAKMAQAHCLLLAE